MFADKVLWCWCCTLLKINTSQLGSQTCKFGMVRRGRISDDRFNSFGFSRSNSTTKITRCRSIRSQQHAKASGFSLTLCLWAFWVRCHFIIKKLHQTGNLQFEEISLMTAYITCQLSNVINYDILYLSTSDILLMTIF